jgi:hypothetical protein
MINPDEERYILKQAWIPEHIPGLMTGISGADFFLRDPFVGLAGNDWLVFVGYPLRGDFHEEVFEDALGKAMAEFKPVRCWFIAPRIPAPLLGKVRQRESDDYYRLDLKARKPPPRLLRQAEKAALEFRVTRSRVFSGDHEALTRNFLGREAPPPRIHELYLRMKDYTAFCPTSLILSAWDREGRLAAYQVLETGAEGFLAYIVGCRSKTHDIPHAADLLFREMIQVAAEQGKGYIDFGLGVNAGIARFKKKWGGEPAIRYESGELSGPSEGPLTWIQNLISRL